ncbi:MAG: hypothetical protein WDN67_01815 [Candidatus Moraniibacteriota bacterium]
MISFDPFLSLVTVILTLGGLLFLMDSIWRAEKRLDRYLKILAGIFSLFFLKQIVFLFGLTDLKYGVFFLRFSDFLIAVLFMISGITLFSLIRSVSGESSEEQVETK